MKKYVFIVCCLMCNISIVYSQTKQQSALEKFRAENQQKFNSFRDKNHNDIENFRRENNEKFAQLMANPWTETNVFDAKKEEVLRKSPVAKVKDTDKKTNNKIEIAKETIIQTVAKQPQPSAEILEFYSKRTKTTQKTFYFYGTECRVTWSQEMLFKLETVSEKAVSKIWWQLAEREEYDKIIFDCLDLRDELQLCDWGYLKLVEAFSNNFYGNRTNESVLMQMYILTQSGYQVRIGMLSGEPKLILLVPSVEEIIGYQYLCPIGLKYYIFDNELNIENRKILFFNHPYPQEQLSSLNISVAPKLAYKAVSYREFESEVTSDLSVSVTSNVNLIEFYNSFPQIDKDWTKYAKTSLSEELKNMLYPSLEEAISGKTQEEAVNILLNFVQTAFDYKIDIEQFGYERALFPDELFYYPYSDCEDRSILFSVLVHDLLNLNVVILYYPETDVTTGHIATAVRFTDDIDGDSFSLKDGKYVVCDPAYIYATVGMTQNDYRTVSPFVYRIWDTN